MANWFSKAINKVISPVTKIVTSNADKVVKTTSDAQQWLTEPVTEDGRSRFDVVFDVVKTTTSIGFGYGVGKLLDEADIDVEQVSEIVESASSIKSDYEATVEALDDSDDDSESSGDEVPSVQSPVRGSLLVALLIGLGMLFI